MVYEAGTLWFKPWDSEAILRAQELLEEKTHPFDEVWHMFPYADKRLGGLRKIWPKQG